MKRLSCSRWDEMHMHVSGHIKVTEELLLQFLLAVDLLLDAPALERWPPLINEPQ